MTSRAKHGLSLLVVEDDEGVRRAMVMLLEDEGHRVVAATNGAEGLARLAEGPPPDGILLDMMMPVLDGPGFLRARREDPRWRAIPVVVTTAGGSRSVVDEAEIAGWLQKPFDVRTLLDAVDRLVGGVH